MFDKTFNTLLNLHPIVALPDDPLTKVTPADKRAIWIALAMGSIARAERPIAIMDIHQEALDYLVERHGEGVPEQLRPLVSLAIDTLRENYEGGSIFALALSLLRDAMHSFTEPGWEETCEDDARTLFDALGHTANDYRDWIVYAAKLVVKSY